ncbi:hypothetical protein C8039_05295 [Halogeometricum sp. wsp3]|nr:hypothetical protein C8039_05295 [Halogeometricum sp. wsp3]
MGNLKAIATYSNGDKVTAEDVKYSYTAPVTEKTENASELNMIDTITVVDEETVSSTGGLAMSSYWEGQTVMVTGGAGFLDSHLVEEQEARSDTSTCLFPEADMTCVNERTSRAFTQSGADVYTYLGRS